MKPEAAGRLVVIDTNILVSALWSNLGAPRKLLDYLGQMDTLKPCYDARIMRELSLIHI